MKRLGVAFVAIVSLSSILPSANAADPFWVSCLKRKPGVAQLGAPVIPGAKFVVGDTATQFTLFYVSKHYRTYFFRVNNASTFAWYMARFPYGGRRAFRVPSVQRGRIDIECEGSVCDLIHNYTDVKARTKVQSCPPELGVNTVDMSKVPSSATKTSLADPTRCAGFNGYFMTDWGAMKLANGVGTYVFRGFSDNKIEGTVSSTARGWALEGRWQDPTGFGPFRFELDRRTGDFIGTYTHGQDGTQSAGGGGGEWIGQCRASMPTERSFNDDLASEEVTKNTLVAADPNFGSKPAPPPGSFTPLDPATVPCGAFNGRFGHPRREI